MTIIWALDNQLMTTMITGSHLALIGQFYFQS